MSVWNRVRGLKLVSTLLRGMLRLYYKEGRHYRVLFGPLRGARMYYDSQMGFQLLLGLSDRQKFRVFETIFSALGWAADRSKTMVDLGGNRGLYALWFSRNPCTRRVFSIEPMPVFSERIRRTLALNGIDNVDVLECACSDRVGTTEFFIGEDDSSSSMKKEYADRPTKPITVKTTSLDTLFAKGDGPDFIKMDIEGGGVFALPGARACFTKKRPLAYVESHSPEEDRAIADVLKRFDYQALRTEDMRWVENADETHPAPNGVWGNLVLCPSELQAKIADAFHRPAVRWQERTPKAPRKTVG